MGMTWRCKPQPGADGLGTWQEGVPYLAARMHTSSAAAWMGCSNFEVIARAIVCPLVHGTTERYYAPPVSCSCCSRASRNKLPLG